MPFDKKRADRLFAKLNALVQQVAKEPIADHVHHLRTNIRRVETLLVAQVTSPASHEKLFKELKRFRKRGGKVRDIDVQISALKSVQLESQYEHKQRVLAALQRRRVKAAKKLVSLVLESGDDLQKRLQKGKVKIFAPQNTEGNPPTDFYQSALESFKQAAEQHGIQAGVATDPEKLHEFRISTKTARYTAELAGNRSHVRALVKELVRVQDAIGDWHDWQVLQENAAEELKDMRSSALVSILQNIVGAKFASAARTTSEVTERLLQHPRESVRKKGPTSARPATKTRDKAAGF